MFSTKSRILDKILPKVTVTESKNPKPTKWSEDLDEDREDMQYYSAYGDSEEDELDTLDEEEGEDLWQL